jgi:predicted ATPase/class 3 adenylate cyclase
MVTEMHSGSPALPLPSGTVTFLFSDIEGSTSRWERKRVAMAAAVSRHETLMRQAIESHGGYVFRTVGDAFCAAFERAHDAAAAAIDCQRSLIAEDFSEVGDLSVRMALHTGTADERDGDYFGPAVNRVARLLAIGHGGQILVSGTTTDLLQGELLSNVVLRDLGEHRLKDLARPERVFQLSAADLPDRFPQLRSLEEFPNNLPLQLTSFVGRDRDLAEIKALLAQNRLVTLAGSGGVGKTRCAIQAGAELLGDFEGGVWLVELAAIRDPALVTAQIAHALGVREEPPRPLLDTVLSHLAQRRLLLILDNCEHVIGEARRIAGAILRSNPGVHVLATSLESLNIAGERVLRLPSLTVPAKNAVVTADSAQPYGAIALFSDRANASEARFSLDDDNAPFVAEICRRLDGIPLALELAAARIRVLSPRQLAQRLDERFRVLTGGDRSALARHQTMSALLDWSYELLSDRERALFRKLAVFTGTFSLETASAVCAGDATDEIAALEALSSLVDKSLVQADQSAGVMRYRLLESTRQYAREKLVDSGEYATAVSAHAAAFLALAEQFELRYETTPDSEWFAQVTLELENWRAVLDWALGSRQNVLIGQQLAGALRRIWSFLTAAEVGRWMSIALESVDPATPPRVAARLDLAEAARNSTLALYKPSHAAAERALLRYRQLDDALKAAEAQRHAGTALIYLGRVSEAEGLLGEALVVARKENAGKLTAAVLECLASAREQSNDFVRARALYAEALALYKAGMGDTAAMARITNNLAEVEFRGGNAKKALQLAGEALAANRALHYADAAARDLCNMAAYLIALARYGEARASAAESLALGCSVHNEVIALFSLQHLAAIAVLSARDNDPSMRDIGGRAARLIGYVDARLNDLEALREYSEQQEYDATVAALSRSLGEEHESLAAQGRAWSQEKAVAEASLL